MKIEELADQLMRRRYGTEPFHLDGPAEMRAAMVEAMKAGADEERRACVIVALRHAGRMDCCEKTGNMIADAISVRGEP